MNKIENILNFAFSTCAGAGAAVLLGNPIGAVGGALSGAATYVVDKCIFHATGKVIDNKYAKLVLKTAVCATVIIAVAVCSWQLAALLGIGMTLKSFIILGFASQGIANVIAPTAAGIAGKISECIAKIRWHSN